MAPSLSPGQVLELALGPLANGGDAVAQAPDGRTVFVPRGAPGDRAKVELKEVHAHYARARLAQLLSPGPERIQPACPAASDCGGCAWQHLSYPAQLAAKESFLREALRRIAGFEKPPLSGVLPAASPLRYRNKAQVPIAAAPGGGLRLGYYREGSHDVVPLPEQGCGLLLPAVDEALRFVRAQLPELGLKPYDQRSGEGTLRHAMVRANARGQAMAVLVTRQPLPEAAAAKAASWLGQAGIASVQNNIQAKTGNVILGEATLPLAGPVTLEEDFAGLKFRLSATSFFQVNPAQAAVLLERLLALREWKAGEQVLELYSGVGTWSLPLGRLGVRLHGVESHAPAVEDARANAAANGLKSLSFAVASAAGAWGTFPAGFQPAVLLVDPPRKGMEPELLKSLVQKGPAEIVYISCDPASLARDLKALVGAGYKLESCQGVDLFSQTAHVESLSWLRRG